MALPRIAFPTIGTMGLPIGTQKRRQRGCCVAAGRPDHPLSLRQHRPPGRCCCLSL